MILALFEAGDFLWLFVDTPLAAAEGSDPKGL
jgi:adenylylsulfate kinase-like enzyme